MFTMLKANWKVIVLAVLVIAFGFLLYMWKSTESEMRAAIAEKNSTISTMQATIDNNVTELKKLKTINNDLETTLATKNEVKKLNDTSVAVVVKTTTKVKEIGKDLQTKAQHTIPAEKLISPESVTVIKDLINQVEPLIEADSQGEENA